MFVHCNNLSRSVMGSCISENFIEHIFDYYFIKMTFQLTLKDFYFISLFPQGQLNPLVHKSQPFLFETCDVIISNLCLLQIGYFTRSLSQSSLQMKYLLYLSVK